MRELLKRWIELEPEKFSADNLALIDDQIIKLEPMQARILWNVQKAIVSRGWYLEMYYTPHTFFEAIVIVPSKSKSKAYSENSMAEALLDAYVQALSSSLVYQQKPVEEWRGVVSDEKGNMYFGNG